MKHNVLKRLEVSAIVPHLPAAGRAAAWLVLYASLVAVWLTGYTTAQISLGKEGESIIPFLVGSFAVMVVVLWLVARDNLIAHKENHTSLVAAIASVIGLSLLAGSAMVEYEFQLTVLSTIIGGALGGVVLVFGPALIKHADANKGHRSHHIGIQITQVLMFGAYYLGAPITAVLYWFLTFQGAARVIYGTSEIASPGWHNILAALVATYSLALLYGHGHDLVYGRMRSLLTGPIHEHITRLLGALIANILLALGVVQSIAPQTTDLAALPRETVIAFLCVFAFLSGGMLLMAELLVRVRNDAENWVRQLVSLPTQENSGEERPYEARPNVANGGNGESEERSTGKSDQRRDGNREQQPGSKPGERHDGNREQQPGGKPGERHDGNRDPQSGAKGSGK
ncbi:MAG TPA: hypothetical protein V6D17_17990 [Candidatus Obscuribacterales bacterium]